MIPLSSDVLEERENTDVTSGLNLTHHGIQSDVATSATDASASKKKKHGSVREVFPHEYHTKYPNAILPGKLLKYSLRKRCERV